MVIPVFKELLDRPTLSRLDVLVYGALLASPPDLTVAGLARELRIGQQNLRAHISRLEDAGVLRRVPRVRGRPRQSYVFLGPKLVCHCDSPA